MGHREVLWREIDVEGASLLPSGTCDATPIMPYPQDGYFIEDLGDGLEWRMKAPEKIFTGKSEFQASFPVHYLSLTLRVPISRI